MCACVHVCVPVRMRVCVVCRYVIVHVHVCTDVCVRARVRARMFVRVSAIVCVLGIGRTLVCVRCISSIQGHLQTFVSSDLLLPLLTC